jgi:hypothetical protein
MIVTDRQCRRNDQNGRDQDDNGYLKNGGKVRPVGGRPGNEQLGPWPRDLLSLTTMSGSRTLRILRMLWCAPLALGRSSITPVRAICRLSPPWRRITIEVRGYGQCHRLY